MSDCIVDDMFTPEEAIKNDTPCICLAMDDAMIKALQRLRDILGFPIGAVVSEALRPFVDTFLPIADSYEQGKLAADCIPDVMKGLESYITKTEVAKARLDRKVKILEKQRKMKGGSGREGKDKGSA